MKIPRPREILIDAFAWNRNLDSYQNYVVVRIKLGKQLGSLFS